MRVFVALCLGAVLLAAGTLAAQEVEFAQDKINWEADVIGGWFSGATLWRRHVAGVPWDIKARSDDGCLTGIRFSAEQEYLSLELTAAGVFQNMDVKLLNASFTSAGDDFNMFLGTVNLMAYPTGNQLAEGRIKPYVTAGPGIAVTDSDFEGVNDKTLFDMNVGGGIKFLLGEEENLVFRVGWRWHYMVGSSDMESKIYNQELTLGIGIRF